MAKRDLQYGQVTVRRLLAELKQPVELEHLYAQAILAQALRNAAAATPQAPMAARNMTVDPGDSDIYPRSGGAASDVAMGSEFGSTTYRQFGKPPNPRGYWLYPAATSTAVLAQADAALEQLLQDVIDG